MHRISTRDDIEKGLDALVRLDPRLGPVRTIAGEVSLRLTTPGFASLASIITSQQVSRASAEAIFGRLSRLIDPLTAATLLEAGEEAMRVAGLSRPKQRTLLSLAGAVAGGEIDLEGLCALDANAAIAQLVALPGIGPWTAEVYLLTCAGHPDIFPAADVALQSSAGDALSLGRRPDRATLAVMAESWAPWRSVAARLLWAYYGVTRGRAADPVLPAAAAG
ncbi:MAG: DNA-3-methyladenine glycosylase [Rhizobiaceae bacterium]|nr:DNA-3-methyladenine glycosylase [Rhizobiaceae bacterium]MCV0407683.1 DNA-3-methyladenine glycosylase [Rhizobiaceae bacterium]